MTKLKIAVVVSALTLMALPVEAKDSYRSQRGYTSYEDSQSYVRHIKARIARQEHRISSAWRHGRFDREKKYRLESRLEKVRAELRYACADDRLSHYENRNLQRLLDRNRERIVRSRYREGSRRYSYKDYGDRRSRRYQSYRGKYRDDN